MKKVLAGILMIASVSAMASPAGCLMNWAKGQGIDTSKKETQVDKWGYYGRFRYGNQGLIIGYELRLNNERIDEANKAADGPWHCHCTVIKDYPGDGDQTTPLYVSGLCGKY